MTSCPQSSTLNCTYCKNIKTKNVNINKNINIHIRIRVYIYICILLPTITHYLYPSSLYHCAGNPWPVNTMHLSWRFQNTLVVEASQVLDFSVVNLYMVCLIDLVQSSSDLLWMWVKTMVPGTSRRQTTEQVKFWCILSSPV